MFIYRGQEHKHADTNSDYLKNIQKRSYFLRVTGSSESVRRIFAAKYRQDLFRRGAR